MDMDKETIMNNTDLTDLDARINAAKARVAAKDKNAVQPSEAKATRVRLTPEEREARVAAALALKTEKALAREAKKIAKAQAACAGRSPAHMAKVEKAQARLPVLSDAGREFCRNILAEMNAAEIFALAEHLNYQVRAAQTSNALNSKLNVGDQVLIKSGNPRYIGCTGTVAKAQRIRCYIDVPGSDKPVYLFTSDVEVTSSAKGVPADIADADETSDESALEATG